jgi:MSHA biogenesis protein MshJ
MKALWKKFADAIDGRNARERALILAATSAVVFMLMDALLLGPVLAERKRMVQETLNDQAEVGKTAAQVQTLNREKGADPDVALKSKLADLAVRQAALQRQIDAQSAELVPPEKMSAVLEKMLANNPRLQLIEVKTLPRVAISMEKEPAPARQGGQARDAKPVRADEKNSSEMYRHGVEVSMRGGYLDLLAYIQEIESLPVRMFWDRVSLSAAAYPTVTMRLVVYTISLEKVWLTV